MNASVSLKFELHSTLTFAEAVQKFSQMLFTHVKPVKINVYCLLTNEFYLNLRLYDACSTKPTVLDCTYSVLSSGIKKKRGKKKSQKPNQKETFLRVSQIFWASISKPVFTSFKGPKFVALIGQHRFNPIKERATFELITNR